ncbi:hypothetical protein BGX21_002873 [Mortierella sp. AD011]|nr:hypothetical protein BGX21_002873 [Mortierella sp. AD011]
MSANSKPATIDTLVNAQDETPSLKSGFVCAHNHAVFIFRASLGLQPVFQALPVTGQPQDQQLLTLLSMYGNISVLTKVGEPQDQQSSGLYPMRYRIPGGMRLRR